MRRRLPEGRACCAQDVEGGQAQVLNGEGGHDHGEHGHAHGHGGEESINLKGAVIHVLGDLIQSLGVAAAGALIWWKQARRCSGPCLLWDQSRGSWGCCTMPAQPHTGRHPLLTAVLQCLLTCTLPLAAVCLACHVHGKSGSPPAAYASKGRAELVT